MKLSYLALSLFIAAPASASTLVTEKIFVEAQTNSYFAKSIAKTPVNRWNHKRKVSSKDFQFVIRENQDILYSNAIVDVIGGATLSVPKSDQYQIIQVIDENHYTVAVIYPGESKTITPDMLSTGTHVYLNARTGLVTPDKKGVKRANRLQDQLKIEAKSNLTYVDKDFDKKSEDKLRIEYQGHMKDLKAWEGFGAKSDKMLNDTQRLYAAAIGWGGLPAKDAFYFPFAGTGDQSCSSLTFNAPPVDYAKNGFWSITTYGEKGWIATDNFALNNLQSKVNSDGTYTYHFNCGKDAINNIDTVNGNWTSVFRMYRPKSFDSISKYSKEFMTKVTYQK